MSKYKPLKTMAFIYAKLLVTRGRLMHIAKLEEDGSKEVQLRLKDLAKRAELEEEKQDFNKEKGTFHIFL